MSEQSKAAQDYSLKEIETWVWDALENGCTPDEIYDSIKGTVLKCIKYHRACYNQGKDLFNKMSETPFLEVFDGNEDSDRVRQEYEKFWYDGAESEYTYNPEDFKLDSPNLHDVHNDVHIETNANSSYNDGWTREFYQEQLKRKEDIDS